MAANSVQATSQEFYTVFITSEELRILELLNILSRSIIGRVNNTNRKKGTLEKLHMIRLTSS